MFSLGTSSLKMSIEQIKELLDLGILKITTLARKKEIIKIEVLVSCGDKYEAVLNRYYGSGYSPCSFNFSFYKKEYYTKKVFFGLFNIASCKLEPLFSESFTIRALMSTDSPMAKIIYKLFGINENFRNA